MRDYAIGELASLSGVKVPTIRYYESIGMLPAPPRSEGNQRRYDDGALKRLRFIAHGRAMGFEMDAIKSMLRIARHPDEPCEDVDALVAEKLIEVDLRIRKLTELRSELSDMLCADPHGTVAQCRVLEVLSDHSECAHEH